MDGKDPYTEIGEYIKNHITAIEDIIATIELDGMRTNELFMVDMQKDGYFVWKYDWWEGEEDVALLDFFPVSDAEPERKTGKWIPCSKRLPKKIEKDYWICTDKGWQCACRWRKFPSMRGDFWAWNVMHPVVAWMPLPEPYRDGD